MVLLLHQHSIRIMYLHLNILQPHTRCAQHCETSALPCQRGCINFILKTQTIRGGSKDLMLEILEFYCKITVVELLALICNKRLLSCSTHVLLHLFHCQCYNANYYYCLRQSLECIRYDNKPGSQPGRIQGGTLIQWSLIFLQKDLILQNH